MNECYWEQPLISKTGTTERRSRKYRDYYFEHDGNISNKDIAKHFNISEAVIKNHKSLYEWDKVLADKKNYEAKQRAAALKDKAIDYFEKSYNNAKGVIDLKYALYTVCAVKLGWISNTKNMPVPSDLTDEKALDILSKVPIEQLNKIILRSLGEPYTLNDVQRNEHELSGGIGLRPVKSREELDQEYEADFERLFKRIEDGDL